MGIKVIDAQYAGMKALPMMPSIDEIPTTADPDPAEDTDTDEQPELEAETCEITEDEMPSQSHPEEQSISQDEVGEMPKDILGG